MLSKKINPFNCRYFHVNDTCLFLLQTNGHSNGLIPMLRVYNNTARYVDQGGNKVSLYCLNIVCFVFWMTDDCLQIRLGQLFEYLLGIALFSIIG
jgi:hypothetical protein